MWWTKTPYHNDARVVLTNGDSYWYRVDIRDGGARPALPYSSIKSISSNGVRGSGGVLEVKYGEYPQTVEGKALSALLEMAYKSNSLTLDIFVLL